MDAILGVYDKAGVCASNFVRVSHLIDACWAVESCRLSEMRKVVADRNVRVPQMKMNWLVLFVMGIGKVD